MDMDVIMLIAVRAATLLCFYFYEARDMCSVSARRLMEKNQGKDPKQQPK